MHEQCHLIDATLWDEISFSRKIKSWHEILYKNLAISWFVNSFDSPWLDRAHDFLNSFQFYPCWWKKIHSAFSSCRSDFFESGATSYWSNFSLLFKKYTILTSLLKKSGFDKKPTSGKKLRGNFPHQDSSYLVF